MYLRIFFQKTVNFCSPPLSGTFPDELSHFKKSKFHKSWMSRMWTREKGEGNYTLWLLMSLNSGLSQARWTICPLCEFVTRRGENGSAASAAAPPELHCGGGGCLGLSHESRTSGQIMNVCIHSRGDAPPDHHSCWCGCDDGGRGKEPPEKQHG